MVRVTYVSSKGGETTVEVEPGVSLMRAALANGVKGIFAECGGQTMCATCHVYLDESAEGAFPPPNNDEDEMLEATAADRLPNSRLSCGLIVTADHEAITVHIPSTQR